VAIGDAIHVHLEGVFQEAVYEDGRILSDLHRRPNVLIELRAIVDDGHCPAAQHIGGTYDHGIADLLSHIERLLNGARRAVLRHGQAHLLHQSAKALTVLGQVDPIR